MTITELFELIMSDYLTFRSSRGKDGQTRKLFKQVVSMFEQAEPIIKRTRMKVSFGVGQGKIAHVPWIAVLNLEETSSMTQGVYCCYLFRADMKGTYLTLNQGVGKTVSRTPSKATQELLAQKAASIRPTITWLEPFGFALDSRIELADTGATGQAYEKSTIAHKYYDRGGIPPDEQILEDLEKVLTAYDQYLSGESKGLKEDRSAYEVEANNSKQGKGVDDIEQIEDSEYQQPAYSIQDFVDESGFHQEDIEFWIQLFERKKQIIIQGPPGTGKTFVAERLAKLLVSNTTGFWQVVQFHPAYGYEDFIQGYYPQPADGIMYFELRAGRFLDFCANAMRHIDVPCVLIIDEINRANLSRVFGELMYLLENRKQSIHLAGGGKAFQIPKNVYIIGTMNTADRSIALVDFAMRRRFSFIRLQPNYNTLRAKIGANSAFVEQLIGVLNQINEEIEDTNFMIGTSFFLNDSSTLQIHLKTIWISEIEPYLEEYFYDQPAKVDKFRWLALIQGSFIDIETSKASD